MKPAGDDIEEHQNVRQYENVLLPERIQEKENACNQYDRREDCCICEKSEESLLHTLFHLQQVLNDKIHRQDYRNNGKRNCKCREFQFKPCIQLNAAEDAGQYYCKHLERNGRILAVITERLPRVL